MITVKASVLLTALFFVKCKRAKGQCEDGWHQFQNRCYYFSETNKTWANANHSCSSERNAQLATIKSWDVQLFMAGKTMGTQYWIGLTGFANKSTWKWVDGTEFWACGEPNSQFDDENCVTISRRYVNQPRGLWNDNRCNHSQRYICEKAAAKTKTKTTSLTTEPATTASLVTRIRPATAHESTTSDVSSLAVKGIDDHHQQGLYVGVGIGVGATSALIIVCTVVALIFLRKRKKFAKSSGTDNMVQQTEETVPKSRLTSHFVAANFQTNGAVATNYDALQMSDVGTVSAYSELNNDYNSPTCGETGKDSYDLVFDVGDKNASLTDTQIHACYLTPCWYADIELQQTPED